MARLRMWLSRWFPWYVDLDCAHPAIGGCQVVLTGDALVTYGECERCHR